MTSARGDLYLIIDDDPKSAILFQQILAGSVQAIANLDGLQAASPKHKPNAIFLATQLGSQDGLQAVAAMRQRWDDIPIIAMTSGSQQEDLCLAFACGVDDVIHKPIAPLEALARLAARTRRTAANAKEHKRFKDIRIDHQRGQIEGPAGLVRISPRALALLDRLIEANGTSVRRALLHRNLWQGAKVCTNSVDQLVSALRRSLKEAGSTMWLHSIYGGGIVLMTKTSLPQH